MSKFKNIKIARNFWCHVLWMRNPSVFCCLEWLLSGSAFKNKDLWTSLVMALFRISSVRLAEIQQVRWIYLILLQYWLKYW